MQPTGIVRKVDELGRIVLPKDLRNRLAIDVRDALEVYLDGDCIKLRKYEPICMFCKQDKDLKEYEGRTICKSCIDKLAGLID